MKTEQARQLLAQITAAGLTTEELLAVELADQIRSRLAEAETEAGEPLGQRERDALIDDHLADWQCETNITDLVCEVLK